MNVANSRKVVDQIKYQLDDRGLVSRGTFIVNHYSYIYQLVSKVIGSVEVYGKENSETVSYLEKFENYFRDKNLRIINREVFKSIGLCFTNNEITAEVEFKREDTSIFGESAVA